MKKNKIIYSIAAAMLATTLLVGCGKKKDDTSSEDASLNFSQIATMGDAEEIEILSKEGCVLNDLTGEWIDEKFANKRPLAIMINNISDAMPQSGIQKADVTFEYLVEGGITRYLCVFTDTTDLEKLGPVRSARHYYIYTAEMLDAIYAHYGWSIFAEDYIKRSGYDNLNGMVLGDIMYYRDNSRVAPHNVYTNSELIKNGIEYKEYRTEHKDNFKKMFKFYTKDTKIDNGTTANKVSMSFSNYQNPWFDYNKEEGLYYRSQYGNKQIDDTTGEQLHYKNVLILAIGYDEITAGLLEAHIGEGGKGYYVTNGEYQSLKWTQENGILHFYNEDGEELKMNPGNTFIEMIKKSQFDTVKFE